MKLKILTISFTLAASLQFAANVHADSYVPYGTKRYYSPNRKYFVRVDEKRQATLYRNAVRPRRMWTRILPQLPRRLLIKDDGSRVVSIDRYYGNLHDPKMPVVIIFDQEGKQIASYSLGEVYDLSQSKLGTTSQTFWYDQSWFTSSGKYLVVQTRADKLNINECPKGFNFPPNQVRDPNEFLREYLRCYKRVAYEQLRFDSTTGGLISRTMVAAR